MEQTYLYEVRPNRIITGLSGVNHIRSARSLYLTKEDVMICLEKAAVYRRFANEGKIERVTKLNVDRMHQAKLMTEEEFEKFLKEGSKAEVKKEDPKKGESSKEAAPESSEKKPEPDIEEEPQNIPSDDDEVIEKEEITEESEEEEEESDQEATEDEDNTVYLGKK